MIEAGSKDSKRSFIFTYKSDRSVHEMQRPQNQERLETSLDPVSPNMRNTREKRQRMELEKKLKKRKEISLVHKKNVERLQNNFLDKVRMNSIYREPFDGEMDAKPKSSGEKLSESLEKIKGISLGSVGLVVWSLVDVVQVAVMMFLYSIMLAFPVLRDDEVFLWVRVGSTCLFLVDMALNFLVERFEAGKELKNLRDIGGSYLRDGLAVDLVGVVVFVLDLFIGGSMAVLTTGMAITKLWGNLRKLERFEYMYIDSAVREQYYGLVKVFLTNFVIGHVLSILLNLMAPLSATNWWTKLGIQDQDWLVKYIWGYYWGTNIMLTVGFGDLSATNSYEALILIFIETFSCITLAYNISYVGAIIGSIREREEERKKKLKFFHRMCKENEIHKDLEEKIANYIVRTYEMKENFCEEEYDQIIKSLPKSFQTEYYVDANKSLFDGFQFIGNLSRKSLVNLAEMVERKICHPKEVLYKKGTHPDFLILQKGQLDMACKCSGGKTALSGKVVESLEVKDGQKPKLLGLDFIKNKTLTHDIRSKNYSIVYTLELERFKEALRASEMDYQLLCMLRDRYEYLLDENNVHACSLCPRKLHSKFQCPRLHYFPFKQMAIYRYLDQASKLKNQRQCFIRKGRFYPCLLSKKKTTQYQRFFINEYYDEDDRKEVQNLRNYFQNQSLTKISSLSRDFSFPHYDSVKNLISSKLQNLILNQNEQKFWDLEVDQAYNFEHYMPESNSNRLFKRKMKKIRRRNRLVF